jgi:hypothetical protein
MSKIDPVSTVALAFLLILIALTSWARDERTGGAFALLGEASSQIAPSCPKAAGGQASSSGLLRHQYTGVFLNLPVRSASDPYDA